MKKNTENLVQLVQKTLDTYKAENIQVLSIPEPLVAEAFVIATGTSNRHIASLAEKVAEALKKEHVKAKFTRNSKDSGWHILDLGDTMVHLFLKETRELYNLESLWKTVKKELESNIPE